MPNYSNPFDNNNQLKYPYGVPLFTPRNNYNMNTYAFVNGIEGAKSYQMMPNQTVLLMDSDDLVCYMKQSDNMGRSSIRTFKLEEVVNNPASTTPNVDYVTKADFEALSKKVEQLLKGEKENG